MAGAQPGFLKGEGVLNSADTFSADKNSLPKTTYLATFDSAQFPVYEYSHYIVKESISYKCIVTYWMLYCMVLILAVVSAV